MDEPARKAESEKNPNAGVFSELKRRKVLSFAVAYGLSAWFLIEVASVILPAFDAPESLLRILIIAMAAFAPVGILLSWYFDVSRKGLIRTEDAEGSVDPDPQQEQEQEQEQDSVAEHRLITVLQVAISPSTNDVAIAEKYRVLLPELQEHFQRIVEDCDGYLEHSESEIVTAYFGIDTVVEAASVRALTAAQEFIAQIELRNRQKPELAISVSTGVDSGLAIIETGPGESRDHLISSYGQTLKSVSMLQLSCPANEIRISQRVFELVRNRVEGEPAGTINLPGSDGPSTIYRVNTEFQPNLQLAKYEIVGRKNELSLIEQCLQSADSGKGQVVVLRGEAGIGKSRLVSAAFDISAQISANTMVMNCSAFHTHSTLYPVISYLQELMNTNGDIKDAIDLPALESLLVRYKLSVPELLPIFAQYFSIDSSEYVIAEPESQKRRFLEALHTILFTEEARQTSLLFIEDLHWADPSFLELLDLLIPSVAGSNIVILITCRPSFRADWADSGHVNTLNINPLNNEQARELIQHIDQTGAIDEASIEMIVGKAEGVPLYLEEFTRLLIDKASKKQTSQGVLSLPDTLQESLAARLDNLGVATRSVLNLGAIIGREFSFSLIEKAMDIPADELDGHLSELIAREVIFKRGIGDRAIFVFKHILIQEAVYQSMLKSQREVNHLTVAVAIENNIPETVEQQPEILAKHYEKAGASEENIGTSIRYWMKAAGEAIHRSATIEADHFLGGALALIGHLPPSEARDAMQLNIQTQRFPVLVALRGYSSESMTEASEQALKLCDSVSGFESRFAAMFGICIVYMVAGKHLESQKVAQRISAIASDEDDAFRLEAHMLLGLTSFFLGDLASAEKELCRALELYDIEKHCDHCYLYGQDPSVISLSYLSWTYFSLGKTKELQSTLEKLSVREKFLNHPNSTGFALAFTAWEMVFSNRFGLLPSILKEMAILSEKFELVSFEIQGQLLAGLVQCHEGTIAEGLENIEQGLEAWKSIGSRCYLPLWYCYFAKACIDAGEFEKAEAALQTAENSLLETGERWAECEILNRRAELAMASGDEVQAALNWNMALDLGNTSGRLGWSIQSAVVFAKLSTENEGLMAKSRLEELIERAPETGFNRLNPELESLSNDV